MKFEYIEQALLYSLSLAEYNEMIDIGGNSSELFFLLNKDLLFKQVGNDFGIYIDNNTVIFILPVLKNDNIFKEDFIKMRQSLTDFVKNQSNFQEVTFEQLININWLQNQQIKSAKMDDLIKGLEFIDQMINELTVEVKTVAKDAFLNLMPFASILSIRKMSLATFIKYHLDEKYDLSFQDEFNSLLIEREENINNIIFIKNNTAIKSPPINTYFDVNYYFDKYLKYNNSFQDSEDYNTIIQDDLMFIKVPDDLSIDIIADELSFYLSQPNIKDISLYTNDPDSYDSFTTTMSLYGDDPPKVSILS